MDIFVLIEEIADSKLNDILACGHAKAGCNGPYKNCDTPVRNSGHWLMIYAFLYQMKSDKRYYNAAEKLAQFLIKECNYGKSGSICHRNDERCDKTNGLIGQAWTIEALLCAAKFFDSDIYYHKAKELFFVQQFSKQNKFWKVVDCDGEIDFDLTFNHQLWFAAAGAMILDYEYDVLIDEEIMEFLTAANEKYFQVYENGLIKHTMNYVLTPQEKKQVRQTDKKRKWKSFLRHPLRILKKKITDKRQNFSFTEGLEKGYHLFDLYGFALLYSRYKNHSIYQSDELKKAIHYALDTDEILKLKEPCGGHLFNKFAFGYNAPAFEFPFVSAIFSGKASADISKLLWDYQVDFTYSKKQSSFCRNNDDPETLDARIYELLRSMN